MDCAELIVTPGASSVPENAALLQSAAVLRAELRRLESGQECQGCSPKLVFEDGKQIELSPTILRVLQFVLHHMAAGDTLALMPESHMLTTNEAARILNVSRPYLRQLLDKGEIDYTMVGSHHRMLLTDVLEYKQRRRSRMDNTLDRLAEVGQEAGDYFDK